MSQLRDLALFYRRLHNGKGPITPVVVPATAYGDAGQTRFGIFSNDGEDANGNPLYTALYVGYLAQGRRFNGYEDDAPLAPFDIVGGDGALFQRYTPNAAAVYQEIQAFISVASSAPFSFFGYRVPISIVAT